MNRRTFLQTSILTAAGVAASTPLVFAAAGAGKIGKMEPGEFKKVNMDAGAKLKAIKPTSDPLSKADEKLMMEIAAGGMMQLEVSKVAVSKAASEDVRMIAQAEVDEQTGLAAKLKEVAAAKGVTLPDAPDDKTKKMVEKLQSMSGTELDKMYLKESGVNGHEKLSATMGKVESKAADATLKTIATTALPLIKTHLQVSQDEMKDMS